MIVLAILLQFSCSPRLKQPTSPAVIEMKTTACFGACPVYDLLIYGNGVVYLHAKEFMDIEGEYLARVDEMTLEGLYAGFSEIDFFELEDEYTKPVSDLPTKYLTYRLEGKEKTVMNYYGAPEKLIEQEKRVSALLQQLDWKEKK